MGDVLEEGFLIYQHILFVEAAFMLILRYGILELCLAEEIAEIILDDVEQILFDLQIRYISENE